MTGTIKRIINLTGNMGWRYLSFRARYELLRRSGLLKRKFPKSPSFRRYITLEQWKGQSVHFFFRDRESLHFGKCPSPALKATFDNLRSGKLLLFNSLLTDLGTSYDWVTNPDSGFRYDIGKHWTEIADYSAEAGDIKFVWEKSRFSYLYDIIRYDYHSGQDCASFVFSEILSWIKSNPVNCGPNYRCSQEMSLRVLNWTFALHYYRNSQFLTSEVFDQLQYAIYWHLDHIYKNIHFSRLAVRNNHAITETLTLYLGGMLYPALPGAAVWKEKGKRWFEEEIAYQVYQDGTFLQFSMNYHRVVIQLLTWGIVLAQKNGERFNDVVYERARKSVCFLRTCMIDENGWLPNYGANDGALFFRLSGGHFRDYRPQIDALAATLGMDLTLTGEVEDRHWYGISTKTTEFWAPALGAHSFPDGGYYLVREPDTLTFIKCGSYKDRPSHADNLHLDVWYKGENILIDAGSYKYNADADTIRYFSGTASHNTVMANLRGDKDQMLKGGRFIWYYWSQRKNASLLEEADNYIFDGAIEAFTYVSPGIVHKRRVVKQKGAPVWVVTDELTGPLGIVLKQLWHYPSESKSKVHFESFEINDEGEDKLILKPLFQQGWCSSLYGTREKSETCMFLAEDRIVETTIKIM